MAYSPDINGIIKRKNGLIISKARYLLFDAPSKIE